MTDERFTLVVTRGHLAEEWLQSRVLLIDSLSVIKPALQSFDVERLILHRCATADEFLELLAAMPAELPGDVIFIREDGGGFLSAIGRGGDRVLYALGPRDLAFYIETHGLTIHRDELALTA